MTLIGNLVGAGLVPAHRHVLAPGSHTLTVVSDNTLPTLIHDVRDPGARTRRGGGGRAAPNTNGGC
jgi:hypothetical protein